jgi:hypothetical protein
MSVRSMASAVKALAKFDMPLTASLRDHLRAATERAAPSMNWQDVADTVWAFATLDMPPASAMRSRQPLSAKHPALIHGTWPAPISPISGLSCPLTQNSLVIGCFVTFNKMVSIPLQLRTFKMFHRPPDLSDEWLAWPSDR